jgi:hypothetical protein
MSPTSYRAAPPRVRFDFLEHGLELLDEHSINRFTSLRVAALVALSNSLAALR